MGFLFKIAAFAALAYLACTLPRHFLGLGSKAKPPAPHRQDPPQPRRVVVEETRLCTVCGAYVAAAAVKCSRPDCPQP